MATLLLLALGCNHISRSGYRKLAAYPPQRLATLDTSACRVAFQHDSRVQIDLNATYIKVSAGAGTMVGELVEQRRLSLRVVTQTQPGGSLPPPRRGRAWTVLALKESDSPFATAVNGLFWRRIHRELERPENARNLMSDEEKRLNHADFLTVFPHIELPDPLHTGSFHFDTELQFTESPGVSPSDFPLEIWALLDPRDGFFRLFEGRVDLTEE